MHKQVVVGLAVFVDAFFGYFPAAQAEEHLFNGDMSIAGSTDVLAGIDAKARPMNIRESVTPWRTGHRS